MEQTILTVRLHANYIETCARFYRSPLTYVEFSTGVADAPAIAMQMGDANAMYNYFMDKYVRVPADDAFPGLECWAEIVIEFADRSFKDFTVKQFRCVHAKLGSRSLEKAFDSTLFSPYKGRVIANLFNAVADKNVENFDKIIRSLITVVS